MIAAAVAAAIGGNYLPGNFGRYNTLENGPFRAEVVLETAARPTPPCILFVGDSRVAFSINAAAVSRPGCEARNYGYPALGFEMAEMVIDQSHPDTASSRALVVGVSEPMMPGAPGLGLTDIELTLANLPALKLAALKNRTVRRTVLGVQRAGRVIALAAPEPDWPFLTDIGRVWWAGLAKRVLDQMPEGGAGEIARAANDYYKPQVNLSTDYLAGWLDRQKMRAGQVVLFIPPSHPDFDEAANRVRPGGISAFRESIRSLASRLNVGLIDCSDYLKCGLRREHFADSVHLNDLGAAALSGYISSHRALHSSGEQNASLLRP